MMLAITLAPTRLTSWGKTSFHSSATDKEHWFRPQNSYLMWWKFERALALPHTLLRENTDARGLDTDYRWDNRLKLPHIAVSTCQY
jgi:hypothetical protein